MSRIRLAAAVFLVVGAGLLVGACGDDDGGGEEDPQAVLNETFANSISSGVLDLDLTIEFSGGSDPGSFEAKLGGPLQGQGDRFPQFELDVSLKADRGSETVSGSGGLTSTGTAAYVNFQGTEYAVDQELFDQYVSTYTALQGRAGSEDGGLLGTLGINPIDWLTDLENEGSSDVDGTETIRITGQADVPRLAEDLKTIAEAAGSAARGIDPAQFDRLEETIQSGELEFFSGEADRLLRRLKARFELEPSDEIADAPDSVEVEFDLKVANVNEPQTIEAPVGAQPLGALLRRLGVDLGRIGKGLRGGLQSGGALPETGGSTTAPSEDAIEAYQSCLSEARGQAELQECAVHLGD